MCTLCAAALDPVHNHCLYGQAVQTLTCIDYSSKQKCLCYTGDSAASVSNLPAAPSHPLPLLASLTKFAPSPLLQWQLLDILYTYCFVMRLYNGDYLTDPQVMHPPINLSLVSLVISDAL